MKITLKLARIGMSMQEATISEWFKKTGDTFVEGEPLYSIETDKVVQDVAAPGHGTLLEIMAEAGSEVPVGDPVCVVDIQR